MPLRGFVVFCCPTAAASVADLWWMLRSWFMLWLLDKASAVAPEAPQKTVLDCVFIELAEKVRKRIERESFMR